MQTNLGLSNEHEIHKNNEIRKAADTDHPIYGLF